MKLLLTYLILIALFFLSVFFRHPHITNEIDNDNQCHVEILTAVEVANQRGLKECHYSQIQTFNNPGDKFNAGYVRLQDSDGDNYYVSYPPLAFLSSWAYFKIIGMPPGQLYLQYLNLFLHFISALFIYFIVCELLRKTYFDLSWAPIAAYTTYLFAPVVTYLHTSIVTAEMFGQAACIILIYCSIKAFDTRHWFWKTLMSVFVFITIYTEWIGVFWVGAALIYILLRKEWKMLMYVFAPAVLALLLIVIQYSSIDGFYHCVRAMAIRFTERSGYLGEHYSGKGSDAYSAEGIMAYLQNVNNGLFGFGYLCIALLLFLFILQKSKLKTILKLNYEVLFLIALPFLLHMIVFFNLTATHYHPSARLAVPVSVLLGMGINKLMLIYSDNKWIRGGLIVVMGSLIFISNSRFQSSIKYEPLNHQLIWAGKFIAKNADPTEAVFLKMDADVPYPHLFMSYIAKRNIVLINDISEVEEHMKKYYQKKAAIFTFDEDVKFVSAEHLQAK